MSHVGSLVGWLGVLMVGSTVLGTEPVGKLGHHVYNGTQWVRTMRLNELKHMINLQARVSFSSYNLY